MKKKIIIIICCSIAGLLLAGYCAGGIYSECAFWPGTTINGVDVGGMDAEEAEKALNRTAPVLTVLQKNAETRDGMEETIELADVDYWASYDIEPILDSQPHFDWLKLLSAPLKVEIDKTGFTYDPEKLEDVIDDLYCMQEENQVEPVDASMQGDGGNKVRINKSDDGCEIVEERARILIREAVDQEDASVDLFSTCYLTAETTEEDQIFQSKAKLMEGVYNKKITLVLYDDVTVDITSADLRKIVKINEDLTYRIEDKALTDLVAKIAKDYPTVQHRRGFQSTNMGIVSVGVKNDTYEYTFDTEGTIKAIKEKLLLLGDTTAIASWQRDGKLGLNADEFGKWSEWKGTYIEISIDEQHLWYYENGVLKVDADVVTGEKDWLDTPCGVYYVMNMSTNNTLQGGARSDYWIGFIGGQYGIHDAYRWRTEYGGDIYTWDGSHGCVNTPLDKMEILFDLVDIEKDTAVIIYEVSTGR